MAPYQQEEIRRQERHVREPFRGVVRSPLTRKTPQMRGRRDKGLVKARQQLGCWRAAGLAGERREAPAGEWEESIRHGGRSHSKHPAVMTHREGAHIAFPEKPQRE